MIVVYAVQYEGVSIIEYRIVWFIIQGKEKYAYLSLVLKEKSFNFASTIIKVEWKTKILRYQSVVILSFSLNHFVQSVRRF